jgi:hypothetical protein
MTKRTWLSTVVSLLAAAVAAVLAAPAAAAPNTIYCLNGVSTTLPAAVSASSVTAGSNTVSLSEAAALEAISLGGGAFYYGYIPGAPAVPGWYLSRAPGIPFATSAFEPGYSTNQIAVGGCVAAAAPGVTNVAVCKLLPRGDGTTGLFQQITVANWNNPDGQYFDATAANWVDGVGLTCDNPLAAGFTATGITVAWGGKQDPNHDRNGVRAAGFNNIYAYFTK